MLFNPTRIPALPDDSQQHLPISQTQSRKDGGQKACFKQLKNLRRRPTPPSGPFPPIDYAIMTFAIMTFALKDQEASASLPLLAKSRPFTSIASKPTLFTIFTFFFLIFTFDLLLFFVFHLQSSTFYLLRSTFYFLLSIFYFFVTSPGSIQDRLNASPLFYR